MAGAEVGFIVWVLVVVWPLDNDVLLTAAKEYEYRSDCKEKGNNAKVLYPGSRFTCTPYEVIRGDSDGPTK